MALSGNNMPVLGNNMALWSEKGMLIGMDISQLLA